MEVAIYFYNLAESSPCNCFGWRVNFVQVAILVIFFVGWGQLFEFRANERWTKGGGQGAGQHIHVTTGDEKPLSCVLLVVGILWIWEKRNTRRVRKREKKESSPCRPATPSIDCIRNYVEEYEPQNTSFISSFHFTRKYMFNSSFSKQ